MDAPNWSPDGKKVIFDGTDGNIWEVDADGTGLHVLAQPPAGTGFGAAAFTPDGKQIVLEHCCGRGFGDSLWIMNADGTGLKDLTAEPTGAADTLPQVSPDGKLIVFNRCLPPNFHCVVATVTISGTQRHDLTDISLDSNSPNWSPDSKTIVFSMKSRVNGQSTQNIATIHPDGSGFTQLTFNQAGFSAWPCFSPDGMKILFNHAPATGLPDFPDLYTMNPDGSGAVQVTKTPYDEFEPEWAVAS